MKSENIRVIFSVEETGPDGISLAADRVGGLRCGFHWSALRPVSGNVGLLQQVYFVWGPAFQDAISKNYLEASDVIVQCGLVFDHTGRRVVADAKALRQDLAGLSSATRLVAVLDRSLHPSSYYPWRRHVTFYSALLRWARDDPRVALIIKPKELDGPKALQYDAQLVSLMVELERQGRLVVLRGSGDVIRAVFAADLVISLGYNSAGVLAALAGRRSVFWDPADIGRGPFSQWFRRIGWLDSQVAFTSLPTLLERADSWFDSDRVGDDFGYSTTMIRELNGFPDGSPAADRIADFVRTLIAGFDAGLECEGALERAVRHYSSRWGKQKMRYSNRRFLIHGDEHKLS